ncbi:uncharacterized protein THITE_160214 [Thermothielavioides terrestris NRRL 8126]|uniref:C2H2-type domain-containing protein n=1 Tax=Thermothielavioides terrestris (strain ATCC 38088 / NRRL 8126) TaxID=578455 RepID=G2R875_THETT|nr:uncharacterized protein THITE_160214 [Thermothielavioides terrestris NRRL 8126]AEO68134.1 hypothetical protein THITE_160214 [Thermothielavioides terrestris NRRL 8126]
MVGTHFAPKSEDEKFRQWLEGLAPQTPSPKIRGSIRDFRPIPNVPQEKLARPHGTQRSEATGVKGASTPDENDERMNGAKFPAERSISPNARARISRVAGWECDVDTWDQLYEALPQIMNSFSKRLGIAAFMKAFPFSLHDLVSSGDIITQMRFILQPSNFRPPDTVEHVGDMARRMTLSDKMKMWRRSLPEASSPFVMSGKSEFHMPRTEAEWVVSRFLKELSLHPVSPSDARSHVRIRELILEEFRFAPLEPLEAWMSPKTLAKTIGFTVLETESEAPWPHGPSAKNQGPSPVPSSREGLFSGQQAFRPPPKEASDCESDSSERPSVQDLSVETEELSISESSEDEIVRLQSPNDEVSPLVNTVAHRLLREYQERTSRASPLQIGNLAIPSAPTGQGSRAKRAFDDRQDDQEPDGDDWGKRPPRRQKLDTPDKGRPTTKSLACPFWKLSPSEHRACFKLTLDGISRVKQHLGRKHAPEFYCEYCMAVLPDKQAHQAHVEARACSYRACRFPGITHQQQRELSRRSKPNLSEPERWFAIWDIVFPDQPRPASPYIETDLSEDLCQFKEFAEAFGPAIVAAQMQLGLADAEPGEAAEEKSTHILEDAISRGLTLLFETWLAGRGGAPPPPPSQSSSPVQETAAPSGPSSSEDQPNSSSSHPTNLASSDGGFSIPTATDELQDSPSHLFPWGQWASSGQGGRSNHGSTSCPPAVVESDLEWLNQLGGETGGAGVYELGEGSDTWDLCY